MVEVKKLNLKNIIYLNLYKTHGYNFLLFYGQALNWIEVESKIIKCISKVNKI